MKTETTKLKNPKDAIADANLAQLSTLKKERTFDLNGHVMSEIDGDNEILIASKYIQINGKEIINITTPCVIPASALHQLYFDSTGLRSTLPNAPILDALALKIILGVNPSDGKMHFLYQVLSLSSDPSEDILDANLQKQGIFNVKEGSIYEYTEGSFTPSSLGNYQTEYIKTCKIIHRKGEPFKQVDFRSPVFDTLGAIFTFQELFVLLHANEATELYIYNATRRIYDLSNFMIKHSLLLATTGAGPTFLPRIYYANLAHLCPPNCARFLYPLEA